MSQSATDCEAAMMFDFVLGGVASLIILVYLTYALARPEKF
jgi:K+-transporting ATPase KdpF subunit